MKFNLSSHQCILLCSLVLVATVTPPIFAEELWNRFRGPNGTGVLEQCDAPAPWTSADVAHRVDLPGRGNGSPVLGGGAAYLQSADSATKTRSLVAIDLKTGQIRWTRPRPFPLYEIHKFSSYASSTPCTDANRVYNVWGEPKSLTVEAYSHDGDLIWTRDLGSFVSQHGFGSSPMRVGDFVVLFDSQDAEDLPPGVPPGTDRMIALDAATGNIAWQRELRPSKVCYGVPCVTSINDQLALVAASTSQGFFAVAASDGKLLASALPFGKRVVSSCVFDQNIIAASEGSGGGGNIVIALDRNDMKTQKFRIERAGSYVPTCLIHDGLLYVWADNGIVSCHGTATGETYWTKRVSGNFSGSPVLLSDKLVNISHEGVVTVLKAGRDAEVLGSVDLEQSSRASIAANDRQIVLRTDSQLWIIE